MPFIQNGSDLYDKYLPKKNWPIPAVFLYIVGIPAEQSDDNLIHWRAHVVRGDDPTRSYIFDTVKLADTDGSVQIVIEARNYPVSKQAVFTDPIPLAEGVTFGKLRELILKRKLHWYRYNGAGSGCLTWVNTFLSEMEADGMVPPGSTVDFEGRVRFWRMPPNSEGYWIAEE